MRLARWCGMLLCGALVQGARAQRDMGAQQQNVGANQSIIAAIREPVTGIPYQAEKVSRSVQKLSDGTVITHEWSGIIARDAAGRMREDLYIVHSGSVGGHEMDMTLQSATVGDPVAHAMLIWTGEKSKVVMQMKLPALPKSRTEMAEMLSAPPPPPPLPPGTVRKSVSLGTGNGTRADGLKDEVQTEQLGQQAMEGVLVTGRRVTTTIPTGKVGNDRPIVVVHEEWRSPELKLVVKSIDTDPRSGEQTMELQGLVRTDPDAALFQAPAGYEVKDMAELMKGLGEVGKAKAQ
ncbi:hypothetical protein [Granulicella arctica]|uniref:Uncharacterized protein n=1 Tax=Granulicella arctica TaxID=940613 RepID=A0A7Y9PIB7_9BACT|nr:hypothetical protein [Granulicella arctica]NYF79671.1 hypothetical protein [Granulicella arctica]